MRALKNFIFYNNTVPLVLGVLFLGTTLTFAANEEAREAMVRSETTLTSVDNSYIVETTITDVTVSLRVLVVSENDTTYFVEYELGTIGIEDGVWQPLSKIRTLEVPKDSVVSYDLGLYVAEELDELHAFETRRLRDMQAKERAAGLSQKVVATEYAGLVGQFFDTEREVFPAYNPLIDPEVGIPLSREQEAAHEAVRRLLLEEEQRADQARTRPMQASEANSENQVAEEISVESEITNSLPVPTESGSTTNAQSEVATNTPVEVVIGESEPVDPPVTTVEPVEDAETLPADAVPAAAEPESSPEPAISDPTPAPVADVDNGAEAL